MSDFKKTSKIAAYFAPQQIIGEKVGLGLTEGDQVMKGSIGRMRIGSSFLFFPWRTLLLQALMNTIVDISSMAYRNYQNFEPGLGYAVDDSPIASSP